MTRSILRRLAATRVVGGAAALVERLDSQSPRYLKVLTYHRVDRPEPFSQHVEHLARAHRIVSVDQVIAALHGGPPLPRQSVLLTFDDGYRGFASVAWPILRERGLPAALFVPTAYPGSTREAFWWDRLEHGLGRTARSCPLETAIGRLPLATSRQRLRAGSQLKTWLKQLPPGELLGKIDELSLALGQTGSPAHEVLGWDELRALAAEGVAIGAHTRTHARLDRLPPDVARAEVLGSLADLEREIPGAPRVFAYPYGYYDESVVELLRSAGVDLAFTTRPGANDLWRCDRLRLRRLNVGETDPLPIVRAKLAATAVRLAPLTRLLALPPAAERRAERRRTLQRLHSKYVLRALDAALTAGLDQGAPGRPCPAPGATLRGSSRFERIRRITRLALERVPALEPKLARALVSTEHLPFCPASLEPGGFGTWATVFRLDPGPAGRPWALKVHRQTLGGDVHDLLAGARRGIARQRRLRAAFGEVVLPGQFLVLHSPLRGARAVACLQPWLTGRVHDLLGLDDAELLALLGRHPPLARSFAAFARRALAAWKVDGWFPDLLGGGNLLAVEGESGIGLWLIDYGIFDRRDSADPARRRADEVARRLRTLLTEEGGRWEHGRVSCSSL